MWAPALAVGGCWLAKSGTGIPELLKPTAGQRFLTTIWQIEAVALALSVAVIIFGFQAFSSSPYSRVSGALADFARRSGLYLVLGVGASGLLLPGLVQAGYGSGAPGGWSLTWASCICAAGLALIPVTFVRAIRSVDPARLERARNERLQAVVSASIQSELRDRIALVLSDALCSAESMSFQVLSFPQPPSRFRAIRADSQRVVKDVRIRRLWWRAGWRSPLAPRAYLLVRLGRVVPSGAAVAYLPSARSERRRWEKRIVRYKRRPVRDDLTDHVRELHEDAIAAIREGRQGSFQQALAAFREMLLAYPLALTRYDLRFTPELASAAGPFEIGPLDVVIRHLFDEASEAIHAANRELVMESTSVASEVVARAVPLGATGLVRRMFGLLGSECVEVLRLPASNRVRSLGEWCVGRVFEMLRFSVLPQVQGMSSHPLPWNEASGLAIGTFVEVGILLKEVSDIGDLEAFKSVNERWSDVLRGWDPESRAPSETAIQIQEHHLGPGHPDVIRLREERDVARDQAELLSELSLQRSHYRFLVAAWKLRRLRLREGDGTAEAAVFRELAGHFRDARSLEAAVARAYDEEFVGGGGALYGWIATEAGDSAIGYGPHSIAGGAEPELLRCFLVLFVLLANPASGVSPFEAGDWLGPRLAQLNDELGRLYADSDLWAAVGIDQLDERVEAVRDALHESVALHRRSTERALAESTPRVDLIERFEEALVQIRRANRVAAGVFELGGSAVEDGACPPGVRHVVCATTLSKNDFTTEQSDANDSVVAAGIGSRLGLNDVSLLNSLFSALTDYDPRGASTADAIRKGLAHLGANGYTPSILVLSSDWRRLMALDLPPIGTYDGVVELPAGLVRLMRGTFEGIPVLVLPNASHDVAVAVDLARFGEWHECHIDGPQSMKASVLFVDAEEAAQRANQDPNAGRDASHSEVEERALNLRCGAEVTLEEGSAFVPKDSAAGLRIALPSETGG